MEQAIGRVHRQGQARDEVTALWYGHTPELCAAMDRARAQALYQETTLQQRQKLVYGSYVD
jgi:hypothetical protein